MKGKITMTWQRTMASLAGVKIQKIEENQATVVWESENEAKEVQDSVKLKYWKKGDDDAFNMITVSADKKEYKIQELMPSTEYLLQIRHVDEQDGEVKEFKTSEVVKIYLQSLKST